MNTRIYKIYFSYTDTKTEQLDGYSSLEVEAIDERDAVEKVITYIAIVHSEIKFGDVVCKKLIA
jgi:hypothetical protein